jgi:hypothetical protein
MKHVEVWLMETSEPIPHEAIVTYTKGPLFCVYEADEKVTKYPIDHIFRVVEGYGTHGDTNFSDAGKDVRS